MKQLTWKKKLKLEILSMLVTGMARLWFGTVRVKIVNPEVYDRYFKDPQTGNVVAGSWHRHAIFMFYFFRKLGPRGIMISRSMDGELTARIARRLGYTPIRGSSSKGGSAALQEMTAYLGEKNEKRLCGTPVDGPRGPARKMKKGMLVLAKNSGSWFIPMACSGTRMLTFARAWDKTIIPKPFSKMVLAFGDPVRIPKDIEDDAFENLREEMEIELDALTDEVDRMCGYSAAA